MIYVIVFCGLSQNTILECAVFKLLQFIQNIHKLHHIKMYWIFSTKSKQEDATFMSFLSRNLICKNIYTVSSFMWSNELFSILKWWLYLYCIFLFSFLTYEDSYSKNIISFWNPEFIFPIAFQTVFCGTYFCDWLIQNCILRIKFLRFQVKITKIISAIIYSATVHNHKNFGP